MIADVRCVSVLRYADVDHQFVNSGPSYGSERRGRVDKIIVHLMQESNKRFIQWLTLHCRDDDSSR